MCTCSHNIRHLPFSATPLRRIAIIALLMSSSDAMDESTLTTSKSTGTQQNLANHKALRSSKCDDRILAEKKTVFIMKYM